MNGKRKLLTILGVHRELAVLFSGIILSGIAFIVLAVTAGFWYF